MAKNTSNLDTAMSDCQPLVFPQMNGGSAAANTNAGRGSARRQQDDAYKAGFAKGLADGMASVQSEINQRLAVLNHAVQFIAKPVDAIDEHVEQELASLAIEIAKQIIRREIKLDSGHVVAVVREAIASLPISSESVNVHLNPEDAAYVKEALSLGESENSCRIIEDPVVSCGGCRISSATSQVDASIEKQVAAISARIFGGERDADGE